MRRSAYTEAIPQTPARSVIGDNPLIVIAGGVIGVSGERRRKAKEKQGGSDACFFPIGHFGRYAKIEPVLVEYNIIYRNIGVSQKRESKTAPIISHDKETLRRNNKCIGAVRLNIFRQIGTLIELFVVDVYITIIKSNFISSTPITRLWLVSFKMKK